MMILDTVMDALSSVFPALTAGPPAGHTAPTGGVSEKTAAGQGDSSFAATLLQLLGGRPGPQVHSSGEGDSGDGETDGVAPTELAGVTPESRTGAAPEGRVREGLGTFLAGNSEDNASETGLLSKAQHGVPFAGDGESGGVKAESDEGGTRINGRDVRIMDPSAPPSAGAADRPGLVDGPGAPTHSDAQCSDLPEEEFGHPNPERVSNAEPRDRGATVPSAVTSTAGRNDTGGVSTPGARNGRDASGPTRAEGAPAPETGEGGKSRKVALDAAGMVESRDGEGDASESPGGSGPPEAVRVGSVGSNPDPAAVVPAPEKVTPSESSGVASLHAVSRDLDSLDPEFRSRLDRVINRMEREYGHRVEVTEGYRSQERQEALYAQGRTRSGSVVTWTRSSLHSQGRAADLRVDGSWENPQGYARLQRVAGEEGLRTLGEMDPGHVELSESGSQEGTSRVRRTPDQWNEPRVARVARISRPASVASTARVARVAVPGGAGSTGESATGHPAEAPSHRAYAAEPGVAGTAAEAPKQAPWQSQPEGGARASTPGAPVPDEGLSARMAEGEVRGRREADSADGGSGESESLRTISRAPAQGQVAAQSMNPGPGPQGTVLQGTAGPAAAGTAARIDEIQAMEEALNARAPGRFHLELDDADGLGTRLRLALRGSQLAGTVDVSDPAATQRMRARIGELHEALTRRGLDARSLAVQGLRGGESGGQADLGSLLQDPLTGLARILDTREAHSQGRSGREGQQRQDDRGEAGGFDHSTRQDREREERR